MLVDYEQQKFGVYFYLRIFVFRDISYYFAYFILFLYFYFAFYLQLVWYLHLFYITLPALRNNSYRI